jgi:hypothetical protein
MHYRYLRWGAIIPKDAEIRRFNTTYWSLFAVVLSSRIGTHFIEPDNFNVRVPKRTKP